jgi:putative ABC transport system substrate-binding protein
MKRREFIAGLGGAVAWPLLVSAQPQAKPVIGLLSVFRGEPRRENFEAFYRGLAEVGFSVGRNVTINTVHDHPERLPALAADLVRRRPAVIVVPSAIEALALKAATRDIPIIFGVGVDPVEIGLVESLNRPGGNLTGVAVPLAEIAEKRLDLLHQAVPAAQTIALLSGLDSQYSAVETRQVKSAARSLELRLLVFKVTTNAEIAAAFAMVVEQRAGAILVAPVNAIRDQIVSLAARFALPTMFAYPRDARAGGLLSYGSDFIEMNRQMGVYTGRILKGEKPGDLPVIQPTKFEFVINLKTAKALGLIIPPTLLAIANEVIE